MLLLHTFCFFLLTTLQIVNGFTSIFSTPPKQAPALIKSRISQRNIKNESQTTRKLVPPPNPRDTLGDYFDKYGHALDELSNTTNTTQITGIPQAEESLIGRDIIRGTGYLGSLWSGAQQTYNISISRCIHFFDTVGTWTNGNGTTTENATLENINSDLRTQFKSASDLSAHLKARLIDNAARALSEAEDFLNSTLCTTPTKSGIESASEFPIPHTSAIATKDPSYPDMAHDELRKLLSGDLGHGLDTAFLAIDGYWTATLLSMGAGSGVAGALYKGFYNRNASAENVAIVCFTAAGLIFARGIIERLYMTGLLRFIEASVISAFTSWFRQALAAVAGLQNDLRQVGSDNHISGCLEGITIEDTKDSIPGLSQPQAGIIQLVPMGPLCPG